MGGGGWDLRRVSRHCLVFLQAYLVLSVNFVGAAAGERPPRSGRNINRRSADSAAGSGDDHNHESKSEEGGHRHHNSNAATPPPSEAAAAAAQSSHESFVPSSSSPSLFSSLSQVSAAANALPVSPEGEVDLAEVARRQREEQELRRRRQEREERERLRRLRSNRRPPLRPSVPLPRPRQHAVPPRQQQQQQHHVPRQYRTHHHHHHPQPHQPHHPSNHPRQHALAPPPGHGHGGAGGLSPKRHYSNPGTIDKFDEFGDYEFLDRDEEEGHRHNHLERHHHDQHRRRWDQHQQQHHHNHHQQQQHGVRRGDQGHHPHYHHGQQTLADTFFNEGGPPPQPPPPPPVGPPRRRRPPPRPHQQQQHLQQQHLQQHPYPQQYGPHYLPPNKRPFGLANSLLNWVGLEALPFVDVIPDPSSASSGESADPFSPYYDQVYNSLDADYYADYEAGAFYRPPPPPTTLDRVADWFEGFKPPKDFLKPSRKRNSGNNNNRRKHHHKRPPPHHPSGGIDYDLYDTGEDHNLVFYGSGEVGSGHRPGARPGGPPGSLSSAEFGNDLEYDFLDVLNSIRSNETMEVTAKKFLSAASALTERTSSSPTYMFWTVPTTIFAALGAFYVVAAVAIVTYQNLAGGGLNAATVIPTIVAFSIPVVLAFVFVVTRSSVNGDLDVNQVMRGDFRQAMSNQKFDGVDFTLDGAFGALSLLGVGWVASVVI